MIDVTVKTLDSQNHRYSVPDDITVKQFKDRIANSVNIAPNEQRLIYCGRVLQDDKNLSDYNVHEKVIHLVMRAPPRVSNRNNDRRNNSTASNSTGPHVHHRASNQGPSSSGVRLQQAKSMLEKAAEVLNRLETLSGQESPIEASSIDENVGACGNSEPSTTDHMETGERREETSGNRNQPNSDEQQGGRPPERENQTTLPSSQELDSLYQEMDALNNMDPPMVEGGHLMTSAMGNPLVGALSNSLQGGLFQAASAAFVSALSSLGGTPSSSSSGSVTSSASPAATQASSSSVPIFTSSTDASNTTTSQSSSGNSGTRSLSTQGREGTPPTGNHPLSGVRGITVRITNRGSQRSSGIRLEHPRCSVMVEVLNQYEEIQRRLQPFLRAYYRCMVDDRTYEENDRRISIDQLLIWRVSAVMHYVSHALHAISDIMIDLRRPPPRQLRARPFIIPQPALVQAQINVAPSSDGVSSNTMRASGRNSSENSASAPTSNNTATSSTAPSSSCGNNHSSSVTVSTSSSASPISRPLVNMSEMMEDDNGVVFMHVGPNGITIDSLSAEGSINESGSNPPPELLQNLMSLTSQLGMRLGSPNSQPSSVSSASNASTTSPSSTPRVRRMPVHNSQAAGNSGTSTTNATQTRVTPRAQQVHVTPLHVPGMGMTQFDPFLPCQSHHVRPVASRRRHRATVQTSSSNSGTSPESREQQEVGNEEESIRSGSSNQQINGNHQSVPHDESSDSTLPTSSSSSLRQRSTANSGHISLFANLLSEIMSSRNAEHQSEEEQQQEQMFAQLVRGVMSEVSGRIGEGSASGQQHQEQHTSLQEFLEPFSGGGFFSEGERDTIFAHLFTTVSQSLSISDLIELFFGDAARLNQLFRPLQGLIRERVLRGTEPSEANMDVAIDEILSDLNPHLMASAENAVVHDGIDYVNTIHNFIRHRLHDIFNLILNHRDEASFGSVLVSLLRRTIGEFVALSLHCFADGAQGLERLVQGRVQSILSGMSPSIQAWSVNTSIMQLRSMMAHLAITDDHIRRYIISPDEGRRMDEARQNKRVFPVSFNSQSPPSLCEENQEEIPLEQDEVNGVEVMDVDDLEGVREINPNKNREQAVAVEEPLSVTLGSQAWHSAVPQDWIPIITRDVNRQRNRVPDTNLSDGYLCGVPLKRRKIATQNKPHGSVQQVLQDTLRKSLRNAGVNRSLIETVSNEVSSDLGDSFATHIRCSLREELEANEDFIPEKFPKSDQKIRKKR